MLLSKKMLSLCLAIVIAVSSFALTITVGAVNTETVGITVSSATASRGGNADISVSIDKNPSIGALTLVLNYDPNVLEVVSALKGVATSGGSVSINTNTGTAGEILLGYIIDPSDNVIGSVLNLKFKVKDTAPAGDSAITIATVTGKDTTIPAKTVPFTKTNGKITVSVPVTGISLNKQPTDNMDKGTNQTLIASLTPTDATVKTVTWSSSNQTVATVDNTGKVTAVAGGVATITATTTDGSKTASCVVTVIAAVTGVTLNKSSPTSIVMSSTETLIATVAPTDATVKTVTWSSSDQTIATVDSNGIVTAVALGAATITVTTTDGTKTATCEVTVTAVQPIITSLTINGKNATINGNAITITLPIGTNVTALAPVISLPAGLTINKTGAQDFTHPVTYTVTALDNTTKDYTVTVVLATAASSSSVSSSSKTPSPKTADDLSLLMMLMLVASSISGVFYVIFRKKVYIK
jgi:uncharacterized protein YjdB